MPTRRGLVVGIAGWIVASAGLAQVALAHPDLIPGGHRDPLAELVAWRNGPSLDAVATFATPANAATLLRDAVAGGSGRVVVRLVGAPTQQVRADLQAQGLTLLAPLGNDAFFARVDAPAVPLDAGSTVARWVALVAPIQTAWKLDPRLSAPIDEIAHAVVGEVPAAQQDADAGDYAARAAAKDPVIAVYVTMHPDVGMDAAGEAAARAIVAAAGGQVVSVARSLPIAVAHLPRSKAEQVAGDDRVQYLEVAAPALGEMNADARVRTGANTVAAAPYGLTGTGVNVFVFDGGRVRGTHQDLAGRVTFVDSSTTSGHATHVAGTIGGTGVASSGLHRGMAPGVSILSAGFTTSGATGWLYTNPSDLDDDYTLAADQGATIANNSIGTNVANNGFSCTWYGDYGSVAGLIDAMVRGNSPVTNNQPFRIVWAGGNERSNNRCWGSSPLGQYFSVAPPAGNKNALVIGAINSNDDSMTTFSSWGPVEDGRLKPDFVSTGCQSGADGGITSCESTNDTAYSAKCGTSMATPTVTGLSALLIEDWRRLFPGAADPRNSTLKAILAQTAVDVGNPGPDYAFGYGSVRIVPAVDLLRAGRFAEGSMGQGGGDTWTVQVPAGSTGPLKVTLAWDDEPATINVGNAWINDLDIVLLDPSGAQRLPWTLNPAVPSAAAVRTVPDRRNNLEQVQVDAPEAGTWTVQVRGYRVPTGPQSYSIASSHALQVAEPLPWFDIAATGRLVLDDTQGTGNGNGLIETAERDVALRVEVINNGATTLTGVTARLVSTTPTVQVTRAVVAYPEMSSATPVSGLEPFMLTVSPDHVCGEPVNFRLELSFDGGTFAHAFSMTTGNPSGASPYREFAYTGPAVAIPDNNSAGVVVPLNVAGLTGAIDRVSVRFDGATCTNVAGATTVGLDHTYMGDLVVTLLAPDGTAVTLLNRNGGDGNNLCNTNLDDGAAAFPLPASAPFSGTYRPAQSLASLRGRNGNGTWSLRVQDLSTRDVGSVRAFTVRISEVVPPGCQPPSCPCPSDVDGSGSNVADLSDLVAFFDAFAAGEATADVDCSGGTPDLADVEAFVSAFSGGC